MTADLIAHFHEVHLRPLNTDFADKLRADLWARQAEEALAQALSDGERSPDALTVVPFLEHLVRLRDR